MSEGKHTELPDGNTSQGAIEICRLFVTGERIRLRDGREGVVVLTDPERGCLWILPDGEACDQRVWASEVAPSSIQAAPIAYNRLVRSHEAMKTALQESKQMFGFLCSIIRGGEYFNEDDEARYDAMLNKIDDALAKAEET